MAFQTAQSSIASQVAGTTTATTLLVGRKSGRCGATIVNDSSAILYVALFPSSQATVSSSVYTIALAAKVTVGTYYEIPWNYNGDIQGVWASAAGNAVITEFL